MTYHEYHLEHHGVKGMKWGVRRVRDARKAVRRSIKSGNREHYNREIKKQNDILRKARTDSEYFKAYDLGKRAVQKAMLRDAGYSEKEADAGVRWLQQNGLNITWRDTRDLGTN